MYAENMNVNNTTPINNETNEPAEVQGTELYKKAYLILNVSLLTFLLLFAECVPVLAYHLKNITENTKELPAENNAAIINHNFIFGIDVSHYQGHINWSEVGKSQYDIQYAFIRATMGKDGKDEKFEYNWQGTKQQNFIRGAYHYYRPNENSTEQFNNFAKTIELTEGDFVPILDVEKRSKYGDISLRAGVLNWLQLAEEKYGCKPMVYTSRKFYEDILKKCIGEDYPLWIASYSPKDKLANINWDFHQFSESMRVRGIKSLVDGNDFNGQMEQLKKMCITTQPW